MRMYESTGMKSDAPLGQQCLPTLGHCSLRSEACIGPRTGTLYFFLLEKQWLA